MKTRSLFILLFISTCALAACQDRSSPPAAAATAAEPAAPASAGDPVHGKELFTTKTCNACHQMDAKVVGPPLRGVVAKRGEEWVIRMIKSPDTMVKEDPAAKALLDEYKTPMPNLQLADEEVHAIVAYLKSEG